MTFFVGQRYPMRGGGEAVVIEVGLNLGRFEALRTKPDGSTERGLYTADGQAFTAALDLLNPNAEVTT
jgi:hypothetical protein